MIADTEDDLIKRLSEWKDNVKNIGMRVNMNKTKVEWRIPKADAEGCVVSDRDVGSNSVQCTSCQKWVHKKCSGIKGSMSKVMKSFI